LDFQSSLYSPWAIFGTATNNCIATAGKGTAHHMRKCLATVGMAAFTLAQVGCSSSPSHLPISSTRSSTTQTAASGLHCSMNSGIPLTVLPPNGTDEPTVSIPTPPGWKFSDKHNSSLVRGAILNEGLQANYFIPNAVVTLADVTSDSSTAKRAIDTERGGLAQKVRIDSEASGALCSYPSMTLNYKLEGRQTTTVIVAAKDQHNRVWVSTVGIQTTEPNNPDFVKDKRAILDGFQFTLPNSRT
jgi:Probable lipoprotein LpqN